MTDDPATDDPKGGGPTVDGPTADGPAAGDPPADGPVLLFDGVCNLCNRVVQFVIRHDPDGEFRFAPLQSAAGSELLARCDGPAVGRQADGPATDRPADGPAVERRATDLETVVLVEDGRCYEKSDAALRVARRLGLPYAALSPLRFVPRPLRDAVYDLVAARRYRWFGRRDSCMVPSPALESRFLD